jgi:tetratricopeptide (TPR) repeat protein
MPSAGICRYDGALDAATAAVDIGATNAAAHQFLAGLYFMDDRFAEAERHWQTAFRLAHEAGEHCAAAGAAINLSGLHTSYSGPDATGRGWLERARIELEQVGPCVEWGYLELAVMACDRPDVDDLLESSARALHIAREFGDGNLEVQAMADRGLALVSRGNSREGFALLDAVLAAISAGEVGEAVALMCFCSMLTACDRAADVERAEEWTRVVTSVVQRLGEKPHVRLASGAIVAVNERGIAAASSEGHPHAHHDRRDRTRHLPLLDPRTGGRTGRVHVQPVPRP